MKSILFITSNIAPYRIVWLERLSKYFLVTILYTKSKDKERHDEWLIKESRECKLIKLWNPTNSENPISFNVLKYLNTKSFEIVILDGYGPITNVIAMLYMGYIRKRDFFINVDGWAKGEQENIKIKLLKKFLFKIKCYFLVSSDSTKQYLMQYNVEPNRIYIHNFSSIKESDILSILPTVERKKMLKLKYGVKGEKIVLCVGQFVDRKRFEDVIISSTYFNKEVEFLFVGGKPTEKYLKLIQSHKVSNVRFIDFVNPKDIGEIYELADLFVLPSQTDVWGLVINEAMAKGLPVIASENCVAALSLVKNYKNGFIYSVGNIPSIVEKIKYVLENNDVQLNYSKKSLELIREFTIEKMVVTHRDIFEEYLKGRMS